MERMAMSIVSCSGKSKNAVVVDHVNGEHLHYRVEVEGGNPQFAFGCAHRQIKSAAGFPGHPKAVYEWDYLQNPGECDAAKNDGDVYGLSMLFIAASKYQITIEHRRQDGSVKEVLSDLVCESDDPEGVARRGLEVFCV
jgi:hypothetical protein